MVLEPLPLVAILRGIKPTEVVDVANSLVEAGIRYIEVPLNSPEAFASIEMLIAAVGDDAVCGAGTVMTTEEVVKLANLGARLVVSPHTDEQLIAAAHQRDLLVLPGVATATEAFTAIQAGATHLKMFPAGVLGARYLASLMDVLPNAVKVFAVGNIGAPDLDEFWLAGARGFGIGSGLFRPGDTPDAVFTKAKRFVDQLSNILETKDG